MPRPPKNQVGCEYFTWNIFQRDGVYYADGRANSPKLGKHSLGTRDRAEALERLRKLDLKMAVDQGLATADAMRPEQRITIEGGWKRYLAHCERPAVMGGCSPGTIRSYRRESDRHEEFCRERQITHWSQVDQKAAEAYIRWLDRRYAANTVYRSGTVLKQVIRWLAEQGYISETQRVRLPLTRSNDSDTYCYSPEQVDAMVTHCRREPKLGWLGDLIVLLATTGMRIGEALDLRWSDVDLDNAMITIPDNRHTARPSSGRVRRTTKAGRTRRVPIHRDLAQVLRRIGGRGQGLVLRGPEGRPIREGTLRPKFIRAVIQPLTERFPTPEGDVGFEHGRFHSFRHYFVSQAFVHGASEGEIREWVGHADSRIVERYRHLSDADARRKMDGIDFLGAANDHVDQRVERSSDDDHGGDEAAVSR